MVTLRASAARPVAAATGVPSPSNTEATWPDRDVLIVAYRLRAHGWTEQAALLALDQLARDGVRNVRAYVDGIGDDRLVELLRRVEARAERAANRHRRGDLIRVRGHRHWPWRTSTAQALGGVSG